MTRPARQPGTPILLALLLMISWNARATAQQASEDEKASGRGALQTAELFARVALMREEIELVRLEMGGAENRQYELSISGAQPHEVLFQALTLFRKADQLCFEQTRKRGIAPQLPRGEVLVKLGRTDEQLAHVSASDVYDIAALLVSELTYLHARLRNARVPRNTYNPGNKLPAHEHQRAGMLERQLAELHKFVESSPDWLRSSGDKL